MRLILRTPGKSIFVYGAASRDSPKVLMIESNVLPGKPRIVTTGEQIFFLGATGEFDMKDWVQLVRQSNFSMDHKPRNLALGLHYRSSSPRNKMYPVRTGILNIKM